MGLIHRRCYWIAACPVRVWAGRPVVPSCSRITDLPFLFSGLAQKECSFFQALRSVTQLCPTLQPNGLQHQGLLLLLQQSFPASGSFPRSQFFTSGGERNGVSGLASVLPINISVQFSSVAQSCPTLCDPMNRSTPGLPVHHQLLESTQTHVH